MSYGSFKRSDPAIVLTRIASSSKGGACMLLSGDSTSIARHD